MPDDPRVRELLDELLDLQSTPEEVCRTYPQLLPVVRERWLQICRVRAELDAMLPIWPHEGPPTTLPEEPPLPQVPGYQVEAVLGHGGMGVVFRARHLRLGRLVALKMTLAGSYAGPHEREWFRREAEAIAALQHPNVVQIYDVGDWAGRPYFTMELIDGGSLAQRLAGAPQPARQAAALLATLAEAMDAAHQGGIVHRDLKPANILFTPDGTPKVTDFGLARRLEGGEGLTLSGATLGTPSYMSPEQARGQTRAVGPAADVYALGAILYELLTGRPPFRAETAAETVLQVIDQEPVQPARLNAKVPRDLEVICLKCLTKEPSRRYPSAAALGADLRRFVNGEAIGARPEGRLEWLARRIRRRPALSASVAIAMLLAAVLLSLAIERVRADRLREADRVATERGVADDLRDMVNWQEKKSWTQASAALERANNRMGKAESVAPSLLQSLEQGRRDLEIVARFDAIQAELASRDSIINPEAPADPYANPFVSYGIGRTTEAPEVVASRIRASNVRGAFVDALDVWMASAIDPNRKAWLLRVARLADRDQSDWVVRARDPQARRDRKSLQRLSETAPVDDEIVPLVVSLAADLAHLGGDPIPLLNRVLAAHPDDFWANHRLAHDLLGANRSEEALRFAQAAVAIRPRFILGYDQLGQALLNCGRPADAVRAFRTALRLDPESPISGFNLGMALSRNGQPEEAIAFFRRALSLKPESNKLHLGLGDSFAMLGRYDEALAEFQRCLAIDPNYRDARILEFEVLRRLGRLDEARVSWAARIGLNPQSEENWTGYAEYCLFLGRQEDYLRARRELLARFGKTAEYREAEGFGRACLLVPATPEETKQAIALVDRAIADSRTKPGEGYYAFFMFARGLAEYRMDRLDPALAIMRGEASRVLGPAPQLIEAMILHRSGRREEARETLARAIGRFDWRAPNAVSREAWIFHILRREAEDLIGSSKAAKDDRAKTQGK
jgi:eukaryotic-like serine/threonine-protein kinase